MWDMSPIPSTSDKLDYLRVNCGASLTDSSAAVPSRPDTIICQEQAHERLATILVWLVRLPVVFLYCCLSTLQYPTLQYCRAPFLRRKRNFTPWPWPQPRLWS